MRPRSISALPTAPTSVMPTASVSWTSRTSKQAHARLETLVRCHRPEMSLSLFSAYNDQFGDNFTSVIPTSESKTFTSNPIWC